MKTQKTTREVTILKRAEIKKASIAYNVNPGDLVFLIKNDKKDVHVVTIRNNGHNTCTCTGNAQFNRNCYHIKECEKVTNKRINDAKMTLEEKEAKEWDAYKVALAKKLAAQFMSTQVVEQIVEQQHVVETVAQTVVSLPETLQGRAKVCRVKGDPIPRGELNGALQSAGSLMILPSRQVKAS